MFLTRHRQKLFALILVCILLPRGARAADEDARTTFGAHPGYLFNVVEEKDKRDIEMVMLEPPKENKKPLSKVIFDEKLSKEFQDQYRYRFGETNAEQVLNNPGRDDEYTYYNSTSVTVLDYQKYQRQFGEYMARRLVEYHFDNFVKSDKTLKPIYDAKDKFSNLNVQVASYKLNYKYNFAGPSMEISLDNPYNVQTKIQIMMSGIISAPVDIIYTLGYQLNPRVHLEALYKQAEQLAQVVASRRLTKHISTSVTASTGQLPSDPTFYQNLLLFGFSWTE